MRSSGGVTASLLSDFSASAAAARRPGASRPPIATKPAALVALMKRRRWGSKASVTARLLTKTRSELCAPGRLVLLLVIAEGLAKPAEHFGGGLEHRSELRLVDFDDVLAEVVDRLLQALLHLLDVMARIAIGWA